MLTACTGPVRHASPRRVPAMQPLCSGRGCGSCCLAPRPAPPRGRHVAVLASVLCPAYLIHTSHLLTASLALLLHQSPFILFPLRKNTPIVIGRRGLSLTKQGGGLCHWRKALNVPMMPPSLLHGVVAPGRARAGRGGAGSGCTICGHPLCWQPSSPSITVIQRLVLGVQMSLQMPGAPRTRSSN